MIWQEVARLGHWLALLGVSWTAVGTSKIVFVVALLLSSYA